MELTGKHFSELTTEELFDIYKLRVSVFVVEQSCPYQEVDSADKTAYHIWLKEDGELLAYFDENLYQPTGLWADDTYVYAAERGGGLTIFNMELEVVSQLGFYNSSIRAHGMCGNHKGELFLMPLTTYDRHFLMKLSPLSVPERTTGRS